MKNFVTSKFNILIVDDIAKNIQVIGSVLRNEGYKMEFATDGKKALSWTEKKDFDLILLDIMMPEMDGFEVCKQLKKDARRKDIPIIFLTAKTDTENIVKGFELGAVDYITKPFNSAELIARVKTHIKQKYAEQQLRELNATKDKFFSIIAHDLKSPFNSLIGFSKILYKNSSELKNGEREKYTELIYKVSQQTYNLLENLLLWSRSQTGRIKCSPKTINLNDIITENIDLHINIAKSKNIKLNNYISNDITVYVDKEMISTTIRNLISNALKFTKTGGEVNISTISKNRFVEIIIADNGVGIAKEDISKLFKIDVSYSTMGTAKEKGTGLGLILCKDFVNQNGGEISVESELENLPAGKAGGTKFIFTLPEGKNKA